MNWGDIGAWSGVVLCVLSCIGYAFAHDTRRALYYFFAAAITITVIWK